MTSCRCCMEGRYESGTEFFACMNRPPHHFGTEEISADGECHSPLQETKRSPAQLELLLSTPTPPHEGGRDREEAGLTLQLLRRRYYLARPPLCD